jgi:hypothetical protein
MEEIEKRIEVINEELNRAYPEDPPLISHEWDGVEFKIEGENMDAGSSTWMYLEPILGGGWKIIDTDHSQKGGSFGLAYTTTGSEASAEEIMEALNEYLREWLEGAAYVGDLMLTGPPLRQRQIED